MKAGELRQRITFQALGTEKNEIGEIIQTWQDVVTIWAKATNKLSVTAESVASGVEGSRPVVQFDLRPIDIDPAWRIHWQCRVYDIQAAGTSNDGSRTTILATLNPNAESSAWK